MMSLLHALVLQAEQLIKEISLTDSFYRQSEMLDWLKSRRQVSDLCRLFTRFKPCQDDDCQFELQIRSLGNQGITLQRVLPSVYQVKGSNWSASALCLFKDSRVVSCQTSHYASVTQKCLEVTFQEVQEQCYMHHSSRKRETDPRLSSLIHDVHFSAWQQLLAAILSHSLQIFTAPV